MSIRHNKENKETRKIIILFFIATLILALTALFVPFSVAEEGNMEEQTLIAKADLDRSSEAAILAVPDTKDVVFMFNKDVELSPDRANLLNSNGFKIVGNQIDSAGVAEKEFSHLKVVTHEYKAKSIELEDILPSISTISSNDKKFVGVVLPLFVYFSKTF